MNSAEGFTFVSFVNPFGFRGSTARSIILLSSPNTALAHAEALAMRPVKRILLVEDDAEVCDVLAFLLGREGYEVRPALSLREAMSQRGRFDLYVIDRQLPDGDGFDLCRAVKRQAYGARVFIYSGARRPRTTGQPTRRARTPLRQPDCKFELGGKHANGDQLADRRPHQ